MDHPIGFLDLIYWYFDTHIAFNLLVHPTNKKSSGSDSDQTFLRFYYRHVENRSVAEAVLDQAE